MAQGITDAKITTTLVLVARFQKTCKQQKHQNALYVGSSCIIRRTVTLPINPTLTITPASSLIRTNQTHHPRKSLVCFQSYFCN